MNRAPGWVRYGVPVLMGYAMLNFLLGMAEPESGPPWRLFSGHWMAFYGTSLAVLLYPPATRRKG